MSDLYQRVQQQRRHKSRRSWVIPVLSAGILALAVLSILAIWFSGARGRFYHFVSSLSDTTAYVYEQGETWAEVGGDTLPITGENAYGVYTYLAANGQGVEWLLAPKDDPDILLTYSDGATLQAWTQPDGRTVIRFDGADGLRYIYSTDRVDLPSLRLRYLAPAANGL